MQNWWSGSVLLTTATSASNWIQSFVSFLYLFLCFFSVKAYLRKGASLLATHDYARAQKAFEEALYLDSNNKEALEGLSACYKSGQVSAEKSREEALKDPEIQAILADPSMRLILEQMTQDPKAAAEHLKNPDVFSKIMKLKDAGIVGMR